jgi:hypothetical protein
MAGRPFARSVLGETDPAAEVLEEWLRTNGIEEGADTKQNAACNSFIE